MKKLYVVGIGPGDPMGMTAEAHAALAASDLLCGYTEYIRLLQPVFPGHETFTTPMMQEIARCRRALDEAQKGRVVAMVCSGDAGVYGMAAPLLELATDYPAVDIEVVAGVTAAQSGAARLGAPLGHDYVVISLSDLLTPWSIIEKRLAAVAAADFCLCIYNPSSKKRKEHLAKACSILKRYKTGETVCGWARNIGRDGQQTGILTLDQLEKMEADMFTAIFVGNSETKIIDGRMVTPRGYGGMP